MNIQGFGRIAQQYVASGSSSSKFASTMFEQTASPQGVSTQVSLSDQAKALASSDAAVQARLDEIIAKGPQAQTADDIDYMQKTGGFVNTMANLSPAEKQLYDELVAKGDTEAVRGMNLLAMSRMGGGEVTLPNGKTFDPNKTEITADKVRQLFSQMFAGPDGADARSFEALASYLDTRSATA